MKLLRSLHEELKKAKFDQQQFDSVVFNYLLNEEDHSLFNLVSSVKKLRPLTAFKIIDIYLDEVYQPTVEELIKEGHHTVFEFNDVTYRFSAMLEGSPVFTRLGSLDVIQPPFKLSDKVKRCF